jgi:hypothetical protein
MLEVWVVVAACTAALSFLAFVAWDIKVNGLPSRSRSAQARLDLMRKRV